ncbi:acyl carrier protein [Thermodesulfobacteriota bacterium]
MRGGIEKVVRSAFSSIQKVPDESIDMEADLFSDYHIESLEALRLMSTIEVGLDIEFPAEEMREVRTLQDIKDMAERLLAG